MSSRRPQLRRRLPAFVGGTTLGLGVGALTLLGAGATTLSTAAPLAAHLQMLPNHSIGRTAPVARGGTSAQSSSSPCWASSNWSGDALSETTPSGLSCVPASNTPYTSVTATWTVPTVTGSSSSGGGFGGFFGFGRSSSSTYSAVWTGIDGFSNDDLIQAGTEQDYSGGAASYQAWWEILPAAETDIPSITVKPGDSITVSIVKGGACGSEWQISLTDSTADSASRGSPFSTCESYSGPGTSAEWVVEAPEVNGRIATLAHYGSATFGTSPSVLTVNGSDTNLAAGNSGEMEQSGSVVSICSSATGGDAFSCAYGSTAPSPPT